MNASRLAAVLSFATLLGACSAGRKAQWEAGAAPAATASAGESFEGLVAAGDEGWNSRGDRAALEKAISSWERAAALNPSDPKVWTKLSHAYYFLSDAHLRKEGESSAAYLDTFEKGVSAGERALAAGNPEFKKAMQEGRRVEDSIKLCGTDSLDAMYWYATNLGKWARAKGFATTVGNKDRIKAVMDYVLALSPTFFHGAPHRYFGAYYAVAPGFAGGDLNKSREHFERSLQIAPNYPGTKVLMADTYATKKDDRALFERLLNEVLAMPNDAIPELVPETQNEKDKARTLLAKAAELF